MASNDGEGDVILTRYEAEQCVENIPCLKMRELGMQPWTRMTDLITKLNTQV